MINMHFLSQSYTPQLDPFSPDNPLILEPDSLPERLDSVPG